MLANQYDPSILTFTRYKNNYYLLSLNTNLNYNCF